jgi:hypothetical protein
MRATKNNPAAASETGRFGRPAVVGDLGNPTKPGNQLVIPAKAGIQWPEVLKELGALDSCLCRNDEQQSGFSRVASVMMLSGFTSKASQQKPLLRTLAARL